MGSKRVNLYFQEGSYDVGYDQSSDREKSGNSDLKIFLYKVEWRLSEEFDEIGPQNGGSTMTWYRVLLVGFRGQWFRQWPPPIDSIVTV